MEQVLAYLNRLNVKFWMEGERLCYKIPLGLMSSERREQLQKYQAEIIQFLEKDKQSFNAVEANVQPWFPLVGIQTVGVKLPFFCVHSLSGTILDFLELARHLGADQPFYGVAASGVDGRREPLTTIEDMAANYIEAILTIQPQGPYFLGGNSLGGRIAFEMAQQLHARGHEVALLAILDTVVLNPDPDLDVALADRHAHWTKLLSSLTIHKFGKDLPIDEEQLQKLQPQEQLNYLVEILKAANPNCSDLELQVIHRILQVWRTHFEAGVNYIPRLYPGKITVFQALEVDIIDPKEFAKRVSKYGLGWSELTTEPIEIHYVPGSHCTILSARNCPVLADKLKSCLERSQAG